MEQAANNSFMAFDHINQESMPFREIDIVVSSQTRFDLDNVALMINSIATRMLEGSCLGVALDSVVDRVRLSHREGIYGIRIRLF